MSEKRELYYCTECFHVFYQLPSAGICPICHNELSEDTKISDLDILTCETCHSLYTPQNIEKIIPKHVENTNALCGCVHNCPVNSELSIGQQETFFGNIVLADLYKCANCGAVSYRNREHGEKECTECGSRFIYPLHWDSSKQKAVFKCANPQHGIRLKIRDLILFNNELITEKMKDVKKNEQNLQIKYKEKQNQLKNFYANKNFKEKVKDKLLKIQKHELKNLESENIELNNWAFKERQNLYSVFRPIGLRCAVYRKIKENNDQKDKFIRQPGGCGSIAHMRIRKIIIAPDGTVIDRAPTSEPEKEPIKQKSSEKQNNKSEFEEKMKYEIPKWESEEEISLVNDQFESIFTQFSKHHKDSTENRIDKQKQLNPKEIDIFKPLPKLEKNQIYLKIIVNSRKDDEVDFHNFAFGVIPIEFTEENGEYHFGKKSFINAFWQNQEKFKMQPFIFDNITDLSENSCHFSIQQKQNELFILPGKNSINTIEYINMDDEKCKLAEKLSRESLKSFSFIGHYPMDKEMMGMDNIFEFTIQIQTS
ncbi:MAG: hypothetical protein ACTSVU_05450 [Promethearchaeota archaeon]